MANREPRTTATLITDLCLRLFWSETEAARPLTDAKLLSLAADANRTVIWPELKNAQEDYVIAVLDFPVGDATADEAGVLINLPPEGYLQVDSVWYVPSEGHQEYWLARYHENDVSRIASGIPEAYFFRGGRIGISPAPSSGFIRIRFNVRPCAMTAVTATDDYRVVSAYSGDNITTTENLPSNWVANEDILVLSGAPPHVPVAWIDKANVISHATNVLEFDSAAQFPSSQKTNKAPVKAGDLLVEGYDIPIVQTPDEAYALLLWQTVLMVAVARSDTAKIQATQPMVAQAREAFIESLQPRDMEGNVYVPDERRLIGRRRARWRY